VTKYYPFERKAALVRAKEIFKMQQEATCLKLKFLIRDMTFGFGLVECFSCQGLTCCGWSGQIRIREQLQLREFCSPCMGVKLLDGCSKKCKRVKWFKKKKIKAKV